MEWLSCCYEPSPAPNPQATLLECPSAINSHYFYDSMISFCTELKGWDPCQTFHHYC
jgi:hypothetical protein